MRRLTALLQNRWTRRLLTLLSALIVLALLTHRELRLLAPVFEAIGIDGFLMLASALLLASLRALPWRAWGSRFAWHLMEGSGPLVLLTWEQARYQAGRLRTIPSGFPQSHRQ